MRFEDEEANASWTYGKNGIVGCRKCEGSPWIFHRFPAKPLVRSFLMQQSLEGIVCLLLFPCWKNRKGGKRSVNSFPPHCSGLQNPGDFLACGGNTRKKFYGILDPWFVRNHRVGEAGWMSGRENTRTKGIFHFQEPQS